MTHRYTLTRQTYALGGSGSLCWVMLNPSTADDTVDDPTIRRVVRFTRDHGYDRLEVVNLFSARATKPADLVDMAGAGCDPTGPDNESHIRRAFRSADAVVFAWGAWWSAQHVTRRPRRINVERLAMDHGHVPQCLGVTVDGSPRHPLYVHAMTRLRPYEPRRFRGTP